MLINILLYLTATTFFFLGCALTAVVGNLLNVFKTSQIQKENALVALSNEYKRNEKLDIANIHARTLADNDKIRGEYLRLLQHQELLKLGRKINKEN